MLTSEQQPDRPPSLVCVCPLLGPTSDDPFVEGPSRHAHPFYPCCFNLQATVAIPLVWLSDRNISDMFDGRKGWLTDLDWR